MGAWSNSNVSSNKYVCVKIMALKPNQIQITTIHARANVIIERVHKVVNDILRSFDFENNNENLEAQEYNPFDYFLQLTAWLPSNKKHLSHIIAGCTMPPLFEMRYLVICNEPSIPQTGTLLMIK
jgi:hypothetical protein